MRVRVAYTTTVGDDYRRAINLYYGKPGLASRDEVRRWLEEHGTAEDDNLMYDLQQDEQSVEDCIGDLGRFDLGRLISEDNRRHSVKA